VQRSGEAVEFEGDQHVAGLELGEELVELGPVVFGPARHLDDDVAGRNAAGAGGFDLRSGILLPGADAGVEVGRQCILHCQRLESPLGDENVVGQAAGGTISVTGEGRR